MIRAAFHLLRLASLCLVAVFGSVLTTRGADPKIRVSVVSQLWSDAGRTLEAALEKVDEAARDGADIVALPMEC